MRKKWEPQMPLMPAETDHPQAKELAAISRIISNKPIICELVLQDLGGHRSMANKSGANGMSADQVLRAAIVKILYGFSYKDLAFHIVDSQSIRRFCQIGIADKGFKKSALNNNIKAISDDTWHAIHTEIIGYAEEQKIEKGREVRIDCTVVESNIHPPSDSTLLYDAVRVLARLLNCAKDMLGSRIIFQDHTRRAKKRMLAIQYAKSDSERKPRYKDLIKVSKKSLGYARSAIERLSQSAGFSPTAIGLRLELERFAQLTEKVIDQAERRVIKGQQVPAAEKIVSLFEPHTDVIIKDV